MASSTPARLHLVAGGELPVRTPAGDPSDAAGRHTLEFAVHTRAGDRLEPWALPSSPVVARVLEQAAGLEPELALRLSVEHGLARHALCDAGVDPRLVDAAAGRRFEQRIDDRDAAYARRLMTATSAEPRAASLTSIGLPLRLSGQLLGVDLAELLRDADPARARAWELASLAESRTMSEWAPLAALRAQNARLRA